MSITLKVRGGLCNRLRAVFSYNEYAKSINLNLIVIWENLNECPCFYLDYFEPVLNISFISSFPLNDKIDYTSHSPYDGFKPNYTDLKLLPYMKEQIATKLNIIGQNYISVHIRRTDCIKLAQKNNRYTTDDEFISFIDKYKDKNLYIATDNKLTYELFENKYKHRVKFEYYNTIDNSLRHTSVGDAIIDIYLCIFSDHFMGSGWSSFSDFIKHLKTCNYFKL